MTTNDQRWTRYWGSREVPKAKAEFFNAVTTPTPVGEGTVATIRMYGPIDSWGGWWGISTKDVGQVLDALPDSVSQIILRINSPGGEVFEAVSILNMLRAHKARVTAVVDGLAASAASVIAAACDETIMSPGTQMMIHSPSSYTWGNAAQLRKDADVLEGIEASIIEIYEAKAGEQDWASLLADETWFTAKQAAELGLADRVAVIPDAGEAETVGETESVVILPVETDDEDDAVDDRAALARVTPIRERAAAVARLQTPDSPEPGAHNRKEALAMSDHFMAGIRERLGVTDADASEETLLAALDEALAETVETETASDPAEPAAETEVEPQAETPADEPEAEAVEPPVASVDAAALAELVAEARAGQQARAEQDVQRRDQIIQAALDDGRIAAASAPNWRDLLDKDETAVRAALETLAPNSALPTTASARSDANTADTSYPAHWKR